MARFIPIVIPITEVRPEIEPGDAPKPTLYGRLTLAWLEFIRRLNTDLEAVELVQIRRWALADQVTLAAADAGYIAFVTDYGHLVRWSGTVWEFAPGDVGNKFRRDFMGAPQEVGWQLMNGDATTYLTVGAATLTATAFTTPNLTATPAFHKSIAAYTGAITAAGGASATEAGHTHAAGAVSGSTASESSHTHAAGAVSGSTASEASHVHGSGASVQADAPDGADPVVTTWANSSPSASAGAHSHTAGTLAVGTSGAGSAHDHGAGSLAVGTSGAGSAHSHGIGTLEPIQIGWLPYFRR